MSEKLEAFLRHGLGTDGPFSDEEVVIKRHPLWWQEQRMSFTASGYGSKIPTEYMVHWRGRWRRVYCRIFSNSGTLYIRHEGGRIVVTTYGDDK